MCQLCHAFQRGCTGLQILPGSGSSTGIISDAWLERVKAAQPEMRDAKLARYVEEYGLTEHDAAILTESRKMADIFEAAAAICKKRRKFQTG